MKASIIIPTLESYEVYRRQVKHLNDILPNHWEAIFVDDGSDPPLEPIVTIKNIKLLHTFDKRPWTQAPATNFGAKQATGEYIIGFAIDHIMSEEVIGAIDKFSGPKMVFPRLWAVLDEKGNICRDAEVLKDYGLHESRGNGTGSGPGIFALRRDIWDRLGGYAPRFGGTYGGDDVDINDRYGALGIEPHVVGPPIYIYPAPREDKKQIFHSLRRRLRGK